jgi:SOUL heme-binding protein
VTPERRVVSRETATPQRETMMFSSGRPFGDPCHEWGLGPWDHPAMPTDSTRAASRSISWLGAALLFTFALATFPMPSRAIEEPDFKVVRELAGVEVRQYGAFTVAEVVVPGPAADAGNEAFPILAGYIFGKNKGERKFAMTAPVTQAAVGQKLEMTAPVSQTAVPSGFLVQFVLPKGVTVANAPEPLDARVRIREVPPRKVAVVRYSGFWSESNYNEHLAKLQQALRGAGLAWTGEPVYSRYDAPFTPWFLRRNEIWLDLADG